MNILAYALDVKNNYYILQDESTITINSHYNNEALRVQLEQKEKYLKIIRENREAFSSFDIEEYDNISDDTLKLIENTYSHLQDLEDLEELEDMYDNNLFSEQKIEHELYSIFEEIYYEHDLLEINTNSHIIYYNKKINEYDEYTLKLVENTNSYSEDL